MPSARRLAWLSLIAVSALLAGCDFAESPPSRAEDVVSTLSAPLRAGNAE